MLNSFSNLRVAVLCSNRAPGLDDLLRHPNRRKLFDVACVLTTEQVFPDVKRIEAAGVPVLKHPMREFSGTREEFDALTARCLEQLDVDTVVLLAYRYLLTEPMLSRFPNRIFNVHDADLSLERSNGERKYVGLHSTRDAIVAGEKETRSTIHYVTETVDGGPIVLRSAAYPVAPFVHDAAASGHFDIVKAYAYAHREWMMRDSWGSLAVRALEYAAAGADQDDLTEVMRMASV